MAESLYDLLEQYLPPGNAANEGDATPEQARYLSRILSLRLNDISGTEPESLQQSAHSNNVSIQALSSRSYRTTTASFEHLSTLSESLRGISASVADIKNAVPQLDDSSVGFATSYSKLSDANQALDARKKSMLLARQADKVQDILELPALLSAAIASAGNTSSGTANYSQALDLFTHIKRLQILYPDSSLVKEVQQQAKAAMKDMATSLLTALRSQNIRLAAAIRTIGWLRRVIPELDGRDTVHVPAVPASTNPASAVPAHQDEDDFGAIFLCARLCTFLTMTEALAPLRDLADQESAKRLHQPAENKTPEAGRRQPHQGYGTQGQQTERYLKRYIEIFREQSFSTISMFRNVFPPPEGNEDSNPLQLPTALSTFPLHLVNIFMETLRTYLPNITDAAARESLLMQVLYAANSLGRLGADFSIMIASLARASPSETDEKQEEGETEPEWVRMIKKHRIQAARLEALAASQDQASSGARQANISVR